MAYRTVDGKFWHDPRIVELDSNGKLLALYLVTNPHTHLCGLYYLPDVVVSHETGIPRQKLDTLWHTLSDRVSGVGCESADRVSSVGNASETSVFGRGFALRDVKNQLVWVVRMYRYQGGGDKNNRATVKHLQNLCHSPLVREFIREYPEFADTLSDRVCHTLSDRVSRVGRSWHSEQDQDQDQDQDQEYTSNKNPTSNTVELGVVEEPSTPTSQPSTNGTHKQDFADQIREVVAHYQVFHPKARCAPNSPTWRKIRDRLKEGYSVDDLKQAINGNHISPFHCGQNERGVKYQSLALIVRDSDHVQRFIEDANGQGRFKQRVYDEAIDGPYNPHG